MCRDRHSTKSHAGDPKFYVAQTQAKHEHDPCQQPNEKWPTQTEPRELHPVEAGYPCCKVDKDMSTQCGQKCQCRDNLAKCKCHQHQNFGRYGKQQGKTTPCCHCTRLWSRSSKLPNTIPINSTKNTINGNAYEGTKHAKHCGSHAAEHPHHRWL